MPGSPPISATRPSRHWTPLLAGLAYGALVYLSLPPAALWPLTFAAVGVLVWVACGSGRLMGVSPRRAAFLFAIGTLPLWFAEEAWLLNVTPVGYPLLAAYLAAWSGLTVYVIAVLRSAGRRIPMAVAAPLAWMATEVLRGEFVLSGYAWFLAAHPVIDSARLAAPASVLGTYFVSFLVAALVGSLADAAGWSGIHRRWGGVGGAAVVAAWSATSLLGRSGAGREIGDLRVGVVQTNVPQGQKMSWSPGTIESDFRRFMELTRKLIDTQPSPHVIVWPETMFPGVSLNDQAVEAFESVVRARHPEIVGDERSLNMVMVQTLRRLQMESRIPMLIGSDERDGARMERATDGSPELGFDRKYNSVVMIADGKVAPPPARYDKVELMPFGEFIPIAWRWPSIQGRVLELGAGGMMFDLAVGQRPDPIALSGVRINGHDVAAATPICFEVTRSSLCRRLVYGGGGGTQPGRRRADLLVNLSNDGWFGGITGVPVPSDAGRAQHLLAARWRCVELGVPMVRAVNTGISCAVDQSGSLIGPEVVDGLRRNVREDGALVAHVPLTDRATIFGRIGNVFAYAAMGVGWAVFAWAWVVGRKNRAISRRLT